jgi:eukaryotic-like serine/threonine-protein kinase
MIGRIISHYCIVAKLGAGGMGVVYRAHDEQLDRDVALKVLPPGLLADDAARRRFRKEALTLARIHHPNIGVIHEFGSEDGLDYLVMEYVPGATLAERLAAGRMTEKEALEIATQIAAALEEAHEQQVVHRDLKPSNVLLTPKSQAKVLDFGLARVSRPPGEDALTESIEEGGVAGTLPYMAPEQLLGDRADFRTDIHSFGALLYEMATGQRAYPQKVAARLTDAILHDVPPAPSSLAGNISPELERIICKCLEKSRDDRYQSARELLVDLRRAAIPSRVTEVRPARRMNARRATRTAALLLGAATVLTLAILFGPAAWHAWHTGIKQAEPKSADAGGIPAHPVLAVLPLHALSGQPSDSELGLGLSDAIITGLGSSSNLTVRPIGAVLGYGEKLADPVQAGKELHTDAVLDGTIQTIGNSLRIKVQLWQIASGAPLWSHEYEAELHDVFALQDDIGARVAEALRVELATASRQRLRAEYSKDPVVYTSLIHGRSLMLHSSLPNTVAAISLFRDVLRGEPRNAVALAWLARSCRSMNFLYDPRDPRWLDCGESNARRALAIDPTLADAYAALADVLWSPQRGFQHDEVIGLYLKALAIDPNMDERAYLAVVLTHIGLYDRAFAETRRALEIEPDNLRAQAEYSDLLRLTGKFSQAEEVARAIVRVDPDDVFGKDALVDALFAERDFAQVEALLRKNYFAASGFRVPYYKALLAAQAGRSAEAEQLITKAAQAARGYGHFHHVAFAAGQVFAVSGKKAEAVAWLRQAAAAGMPGYPIYHDDATLKRLDGYPQYGSFLGELRDEWNRRRALWPASSQDAD